MIILRILDVLFKYLKVKTYIGILLFFVVA